jgi:chromosome segregation ATPase
MTDPNLTAKLRADCEALRNDVQQSRELAADFQRQLAGKSNEFATLKRVLDESRVHLAKLEHSIQLLRDERHRLANEAMRAAALERLVADRDAEIIFLKSEIAELNRTAERGASADAAAGIAQFLPWRPAKT